MSSIIGPMALGHKDELVFLGRDFGEQRNYSEADGSRDRLKKFAASIQEASIRPTMCCFRTRHA